MKDRNSIVNHRIRDKFVDREVYYCVSMMVSELAKKAEHFPEWGDDLYGAFETLPDYEDAARDHDWEISIDEDGESCFINTYTKEISYADDWEQLVIEENIDADDYRREVFEHWAVSRYLARQLEQHGEKVIEDILGIGPIWCRTTSGQAIAMDRVIGDICEEMKILDGQANDWSK